MILTVSLRTSGLKILLGHFVQPKPKLFRQMSILVRKCLMSDHYFKHWKDIGCNLTDKSGEVILVRRSIINYLCLFACSLITCVPCKIFRDVFHRDNWIMYIRISKWTVRFHCTIRM